jgi:hypothetical protein
MIESLDKNLQIFLAYLVIGGLPFYYFFRDHITLSSTLYALLFGLLFLVCLFINLKKKIHPPSKTSQLLLLEVAMIVNLIVVFIYLGHLERSLILMFMTLYISKSFLVSTSHHGFVTTSNIIVCSSFFTGLGVMLGILEHTYADTNWLSQKMGFDYPYSDGIGETTLINGFFASANGSAYALGAGLAFIKFQKIINGMFKKTLYLFFIISLFITKAKFAFLIAATFLGFRLLKRFNPKWLLTYLLILGLSYIFLSHIMIAIPGTYDYPSLHFRKLLFNIGPLDFILGNYAAFKLYTFEAITLSFFLPMGLDIFVETYSGRPHFMIGALIISGGLAAAILAITYIFLILRVSWNEIPKGLEKNYLYLAILFCFSIETINWNFTNNFYFWSILMGLTSINHRKNISSL